MWNRKELKQRAKIVVKKNYWTAIVVCFLIALLTGEFGTSIVGVWQSNDSMDPNYVIVNENEINGSNIEDNSEELVPYSEKKLVQSLDVTQRKIFEIIEANLNSATKSQKYIFKIWDAVNFFNINKIDLGILLSIGALIAFLFAIFVADPLTVAGKRYFLKARQGSNTKLDVIAEIFKKKKWINVAIIMFLRNTYTALWYITIVGGIIKTYEYRMIPYILAENPEIKRKEAFKLSKQMMRKNKWKTFILDMSFFGWNFLSVITGGLVGILYVNPYNSATIAELYATLRSKAIKEKYEYCEALNDKNIKEETI